MTQERRKIAFCASLVCMTCAGTLYLFGAYAQALQQKRSLSQTALNLIASSGGFGQYLSGPVWGKLSDTYDRQKLCAAAGVFLLAGYLGLASGYASDLVPVPALALAYALIGLGSSGLFNASLSTSVKNYDEREHGFAVGVPVAFFGLSAFIFSQLQRLFIVGSQASDNAPAGSVDIFSFLCFVGAVTGGGAMAGATFLYDCSASLRRRGLSQDGNEAGIITSPTTDASTRIESVSLVSTPILPTVSGEQSPLIDNQSNQAEPLLEQPSIFAQQDAYLLFAAFILLTGTGLMYINNVGAIVIALIPKSTPTATIQATQRLHVGLISICNCLGRVVTGLGSDRLMHQFKLTRLVGLVAGGGMITAALLWGMLGLYDGHAMSQLIPVTLLLGFGYGSIFSAAPAIVGRWFGVQRFGTNWGWFQWAPAIGGQVCNLVFGLYVDAARRAGGQLECHGTVCFTGAFWLAFCGCCASVGILLALNQMRGGWIVTRSADV
ncbi:hypothetical protein HDU80_003752 [Chytriomyces hyalinus]|nr:hypothetical protein HDU80_003752 [Chytriomyces hyalinus]